MKTTHDFFIGDSTQHNHLPAESVDLVVTSPPYPMIRMWDEVFAGQDQKIQQALQNQDGLLAFELMNQILDQVWDEVYRVLKFGGFACVNIGDAVRTLNDRFMLYANHARILGSLQEKGFSPLPAILWRKQTNAPNKFMGSGMLPAGAYVTLEHEYILVLRKGGKRAFQTPEEKANRHKSAIFWEERNQWFSDVWMDLKGTVQKLDEKELRNRSGAFPFELPYRLICMYSAQGDVVFDPFLGMGTTMMAAMAAGRNSLGFERETNFQQSLVARMKTAVDVSNDRIFSRLENHRNFIAQRIESGKPVKYRNRHYGFPVVTAQEQNLMIPNVSSITQTGDHSFAVTYSAGPQDEFCRTESDSRNISERPSIRKKRKKKIKKPTQLDLF